MSATRRLEFIARTQLTGAAASVSFATIDTDFRKFFLVCYIVNDANAKSVAVRFNNDTTGANYYYQFLDESGTSEMAGRGNSDTITVWTMAANTTGLFILEISKPVAGEVARFSIRGAYLYLGNIVWDEWAKEWSNTAALISRVDVVAASNNFAAGTRILLYGSRD